MTSFALSCEGTLVVGWRSLLLRQYVLDDGKCIRSWKVRVLWADSYERERGGDVSPQLLLSRSHKFRVRTKGAVNLCSSVL